MPIIWSSPGSYITTNPTLHIEHIPPAHVRVTCTSAGTKSIFAALPLPGASVEEIIICYECSNDASHIAGIGLVETALPGRTIVRLDSPIRLQSTTPICVPVNVTRFTPAGSVILELRLRFDDVAHEISFGGLGVRIGDNCSVTRNDHLLGEFGPYSDAEKAHKTLNDAIRAIRAQSGGVLCIPRDAPRDFFPRNRNPEKTDLDTPAVTIIDYRHGVERTYVPPIGVTNSEGSAASSRIIERDVAVDLGWQNVLPAMAISSRCVAGASSYSTVLTRDTGADRRLCVPTLRGAFIGQQLLVGPPGSTLEWPRVTAMGIDPTDGPYLTMDKLDHRHFKGDQVYNKNDVGGLWINDTSNCDNQSESLTVSRTTYGTGDSFGIASILTYQGNINSGGGDEGGVAVAGNLLHDIDCFRGEVKSWDKDKHRLTYKTNARHPQKLGTSRPIINLHPSKQLRDGKVTVTTTAIIGDATASGTWSDAVVGRFIAIDDPTEYQEIPDGAARLKVHRWWLITRIVTVAGLKQLNVERAIADPNKSGAPKLFLTDNYGRDLPYIIAPGAWVSDLRDGVAGNELRSIGVARDTDPRTITLAPSPIDGSIDYDFAENDPIINPPGPDVWIPTGFRAHHAHHFPGSSKGYSFLSRNLGTVQVGPAVGITGREAESFDLEAVRRRMKDRSTEYESGIFISAATDTAIVVQGAVSKSAIDFWQKNNNVKKIRWFAANGVSAGELHVDPVSHKFMFAGGDLDLHDKGTVAHGGISATRTRSASLGKRNQDLPKDLLTVTLSLLKPETDTDYTIFVSCSWMTMTLVTRKTLLTFDVDFSARTPNGATLDWFLVRL